jgi:hypothetical protein
MLNAVTSEFVTLLILMFAGFALVIFKLERMGEEMAAQGQGFTNLSEAVAADTAELQAEQAAFTALEAEIAQLIATGAGNVTDAQLQALADTLTASQTARAAAVAAANAAIPPATPAAPASAAS